MDKISVIIPVYNAENYIDRCLKSVINQTYRNMEIIIIDDKSTDKTFTICEKYRKNDTRIKLFENKNKGVASARNYGLEQATGTYITFVDSDDWLEVNMYEIMIRNIEENQVDFALCGVFINYKNLQMIRRNSQTTEKHSSEYFVERIYMEKDIMFNLWNMVAKREKIKYVRMDKRIWLGEDNLYILEMLANEKSGVIIRDCFYHYYQNETSLTHNVRQVTEKNFSGLYSVEGQAKLLKEYYPSIFENYKYIILRNYVNTCREMAQDGFHEKKWIKFMKQRIRKELLNGGCTCKNAIKKSVVNGFLISVSFNSFYYIYRYIHRDEIKKEEE